jgi:citrate lyase beta subunit
MVLLDLEDAVAPTEKEAARATVAEAVGTGDWGDAIVAVRVNDWSTRWTTFDILEVVAGAGPRLDEIVLRAPTASRWSTVPTCGFGTSTGCGTTASGPAPWASTASGPSTPTQLPIVNEAFSPTQEQFDRACAVLDALDAAAGDEGRGAVRLGDEMVDEASRKMAVKMVARGERAGLGRTSPG